METTFTNVTITIRAEPKEAYRQLAEIFHPATQTIPQSLEYATDQYHTDTQPEVSRSTEELFGEAD